MKIKILSFDPGVTTGYAIFEFPNDLETIPLDGTSQKFLCEGGELKKYNEFRKIFKKDRIDLVVIESFKLYPHKAKAKTLSNFPTVEIIGVIKFLSFINNIPLIEQGANTKKFYDNKKLRMCGLFERGQSPHLRDAYRHALYAFDFNSEVKNYC